MSARAQLAMGMALGALVFSTAWYERRSARAYARCAEDKAELGALVGASVALETCLLESRHPATSFGTLLPRFVTLCRRNGAIPPPYGASPATDGATHCSLDAIPALHGAKHDRQGAIPVFRVILSPSPDATPSGEGDIPSRDDDKRGKPMSIPTTRPTAALVIDAANAWPAATNALKAVPDTECAAPCSPRSSA